MFCLWFLEIYMVGYVMVTSTVLTENVGTFKRLEVSSLNYPTCKIPLKKKKTVGTIFGASKSDIMNFFLNGCLQELVSINIEQ